MQIGDGVPQGHFVSPSISVELHFTKGLKGLSRLAIFHCWIIMQDATCQGRFSHLPKEIQPLAWEMQPLAVTYYGDTTTCKEDVAACLGNLATYQRRCNHFQRKCSHILGNVASCQGRYSHLPKDVTACH